MLNVVPKKEKNKFEAYVCAHFPKTYDSWKRDVLYKDMELDNFIQYKYDWQWIITIIHDFNEKKDY
jgi:hypothetical protein